ncbi:MAG: hypothetical protein WC661_09455 [Opitutaceae bacterium]|jgi:hypothetical protein
MKRAAYLRSSGRRTHWNQEGFALLITITLLAFLVLLLVSLASLARVETQVAGNDAKQGKARANALMALNLALGQLQKFAGPDKAVGARADITSAGALTQPYLTGIWKTSNATSTPDAWLVSGNETSPITKTPSNVPSPATGTEPVADGSSGYVFLVGSNSVSANAQRVRLDKQPITAAAGTIPGLAAAATVGNYAYWVGDEGIKASASLINPLLTANAIAYDNATGSGGQGDNWNTDTDKRARLDQMQLTRARLEHLFPAFDPDTDGLAGLPNVKNPSQLLLMPHSPTAAQLKAQFYSLTPLSRAVLVDLPNGRLKKDLSDITVPPDPAILKYQQTRLTPVTGFTAYYTPVAASVPTAATYPAYSLGPVPTEVGIRFNFYISTADNTVHYSYLVEAELWNPYAAELHLAATSPLTLEISGLPAITVTTDGTTNRTFTPTVTATVNAAATSTWTAGQIQVFRGGTALEPVASPGPMSDQIVPGATADATATTVTATYLASSALRVVVKVGGNVLTTCTPTITFTPGSVSNGTAAVSTGWLMGYGYEFADDLSVFTHGAAATSFDPRLPVLNGNFNNASSTVWTTTPANNTSSVGTANTFSIGNPITLFDLPRQEMTSLGMLTQVIGAKPCTAGNPWGGTANAIFDQYHMSTVPRFASTWTPESGLPLPNRYTAVYHPDNTPTVPIADLRSSSNSARYLLQAGAFNINSTSVEAWSAVLGSKFAAWKYSANATTGIALDNVFFRLPHGAQQLANPPVVSGGSGTGALTDANAQNTGGRQLTSAEITSLATQIVSQIRTHARPYVSLQDFINSGVIANAISAANLNGTLGATKRYSPGALTQADVIGSLAPFITARSDTFLIRTYGDVQNPATGLVEGRAWCEALVQRLPDLADNASAPIADIVAPNTATYPTGRKFKIISFRWLASSDI